MRQYFWIFIFLLLSVQNLFGQVTAPKYANEFLAIGVGSRALAMGNTQVSIVDDATAGYWNPAGLLNQKDKYNIGLMHSELLAGIVKNDFASYTTPIDSFSHIGVSIIRVGIDDIPNTLNLIDENGIINYDNITYFGVADYGFLFSYAKRSALIPGLKIGANAKVIYRHVGPFANAWGFGIDAGAQLNHKNWLIGVMARDIATTVTAWFINTDLLADVYLQNDNEVPDNSIEITLPKLIFGIGRKFMVKERFSILPAIDVDLTTDGRRNTLVRSGVASLDPHAGMELGYKDIVFIRGGVNNVQKIKDFDNSEFWVLQPNFGLGLQIKKIGIDYALSKVSDGESGLYSHIFSLNFAFNR